MNYIKGFWSSSRTTSPSGEVQSQPNTIHGAQAANFNAVTFTTVPATSGNSIIITTVPATPQNTQQIVYHNNQNINELKPPQMASPTESYHSATSNFDQNNGKVNLAYAGSTSEINNNKNEHTHHHHHNHRHTKALRPRENNQMVVREQYWTWNFFWTRWNNREKIFLIIIVALSLCVLVLTSVLSWVVQQNFQYRDLIFSKLDDDATSLLPK